MKTILLTVSFSLLSSCLVHSRAYNVPASANIFSAGRPAPIAPGGNGAGTLPVQIPFAPGLDFALQFQGLGGTVSPYLNVYSLGPEGLVSSPVDILAYSGISGYKSDWAFSLAGIFLTDAAPADPSPLTLDFSPSGLGRNFTTLNPQIGQVFFIGDGQTDGAATQSFNVPQGATRFYLGFTDCQGGTGYPGSFADNTGSLSIGVTLVPEPGSSTLLLVGTGLALCSRRALRKR